MNDAIIGQLRWQTPDGVPIFARHWPVADPCAAAVIIHGLGDHSGRFAHVAAALNDARISVVAADMRGHGLSGGPRGFVRSFQALVDDLDLCLRNVSEHETVPLTVLGFSLGAIVSVWLALQRPGSIAGLVLFSPMFRLAIQPPRWKVVVGQIANRVLPRLTLATGVNARQLTHDEQAVEEFRRDPLRHRRVSPRMFFGAMQAAQQAIEHAAELSAPTLLLHGQEDAITAHQGSEEFARRCGANCELKIWPGLFHELHHENEKDAVISYAVSWIQRAVIGR